MESAYEPKKYESKIYKLWEESGFFNPDNLPNQDGEAYSIMIAPPNITGSLHMGHALENTISDILIRHYRMKGFKTLWLPGTDHAGIATQNVVEKDLKKQNLTRIDLGKEKFLEKIWEWREKYGDIILNQLKQLGCSLDWSRTRFTMDENYQAAVKKAFEHYLEKGMIYQGEKVINWCIKDQTALSDLELEYVEEKGKLWHIKYPIKDSNDFIEVATTRPETMLGDTAVAVNPADLRYKKLIGQTVIVPIINREVPIIADQMVDKDFGTGAVKITPAHDMADSDTGERHNLKFIKVINEIGKIINVNDEFNGKKIIEARELVISKLKELGLLVKEEEITHNVAKCYRCGSTVEPMLSKQWFLKTKLLAEKVLTAIEKNEVVYKPERWKKIAEEWLKNIRDWCISRQIWWGHNIPMEGNSNTFDTWFSSALWPFATLGWPKQTEDLKKFYPSNVITSARDILHLWITRMIFSGIEFMGEVPFKEVYIHPTILALDGKRMSKSLGTGIDPLVLIEKYGADATRFGLILQINHDQQAVRFDERSLISSKNFINKLWNISRFIQMKCEENKSDSISSLKPITLADQWILSRMSSLTDSITKKIEKYELGEAAKELYEFTWHEFADWYLEISKFQNENPETQNNTVFILKSAILNLLKLLHPFIPFVTEEIYGQLTGLKQNNDLLIIAKWPEIDKELINPASEEEFEKIKNLVIKIRNWRMEQKITFKEIVDYNLESEDKKTSTNPELKDLIEKLTKVTLKN
ncbi:MAG: valine--tRNA ligase [Patescibacteria group bacterium]|nr:valine--tRNA ligase [Patescibacteria group bacterium]MDD5164601.1 valine--tRNA ligase [Patescibacteria group bacterium]MDD5534356.1 valine--tRNA ligase [Patescibacteria group bacterium]